jgi:lactate dehydrogenase-like 2-hydroxyacid dehydrogenase
MPGACSQRISTSSKPLTVTFTPICPRRCGRQFGAWPAAPGSIGSSSTPFPTLRIIASYGVGYDSVDAAYARSKNIVVTNTPDVLNEEVADLTLGLLISVVREIPKAEAFVREGRWKSSDYPLSRLTLRNRRVGIYGMGRIGRCIARRVEAFGLPIAYHSRRPADGIAYDYFPSLLELAGAVDTLISIVPGTRRRQTA